MSSIRGCRHRFAQLRRNMQKSRKKSLQLHCLEQIITLKRCVGISLQKPQTSGPLCVVSHNVWHPSYYFAIVVWRLMCGARGFRVCVTILFPGATPTRTRRNVWFFFHVVPYCPVVFLAKVPGRRWARRLLVELFGFFDKAPQ